MLGIPHCLDSRLTDGGEVVSLTHRPRFTPQKHSLSASDVHLCQRLSKSQGLVRPAGLGKLKKFIHLIAPRTLDLPACSIVPQPLRPKVKTYLCFINLHDIETYTGVELWLRPFSNPALDGGERPASRPSRFTSEKGFFGSHRIGWVDTRISLNTVEQKQNLLLLPGNEPRPSSP
jgi:hypothetical protein